MPFGRLIRVYRLAQISCALRQLGAQLKDGTLVCPLASDKGEVFFTLNGILLPGNTVSKRYVLHQHLANLGLAGAEVVWDVGQRDSQGAFILLFKFSRAPCDHISFVFSFKFLCY